MRNRTNRTLQLINLSLPSLPTDHVTLILNTDASWNDRIRRGGVGWILQDASGSIVQAGQKCITNQWSIDYFEAYAIFEGLSSINVLNRHILVKSNSLKIVRLLNESCVSILEVDRVVQKINILKSLWPSVSFIYISRVCNVDAHRLA